MYFYLLRNFIDKFGNASWKGLDISRNIGGSQVYPQDFVKDNRCLVASTENIVSNGDILQITEQEYNRLKTEIEGSKNSTTQPNLEDRVITLENALLKSQGVI